MKSGHGKLSTLFYRPNVFQRSLTLHLIALRKNTQSQAVRDSGLIAFHMKATSDTV
jgi:hypothetical protein